MSNYAPHRAVLLALSALCLCVQAQTGFSTNMSASAPGKTADAASVTEQPFAQGFDRQTDPFSNQRPTPSRKEQITPLIYDLKSDSLAFRQSDRPALPNQFQRFVQESTGRLLPIYGQDLFDTPQAYNADTHAPIPPDYLLGAGDELYVQVWGTADFTLSLTLDRNGQVNIPKVGVITLAGVAVRDLEKTLRSHISKIFTNISVSASLGRLRGIQVYVVGQARMPGTVQLSSLGTLVNALFASGGPNSNGSMRAIELKRNGKTVATFDLYDFLIRGDKSGDLSLMSGDVIVIPPVGSRIAVTGAFDQAAIFELKSSGTTVGEILKIGGGVPALAKTQKALLERIKPDSNPPRQVQEIALNAQGLKEVFQDGDVLTLLEISVAFGNAVTLQGIVAEPLRYRWFEGMKILDLIPERDALITKDYYKRKNLLVQKTESVKESTSTTKMALTGINEPVAGAKANVSESKVAGSKLVERVKVMADQINWEYAVIERLDKDKLSTELIPFNLGKVILSQDPLHNLSLKAGDVVTILSQNDLKLPQDRQTRLVRVEGEVLAPGIYQAKPGETLPQLLNRIGGITPQAYLFGTEFNRETVRLRQQENLEILVRRVEAQAQSQASSLSSNLSPERIAQAQMLQQQQQAQTKAQVEKLRTLKSNGRVALELDPGSKTLADFPNMPLEDGDRIYLPAMAGFVSALGSVNNENVFIYKSGKTVADIIRSAGLTEDAEPDQAFVLRADGSIIARRDRTGYFGGSFESLPVMPGDTVVVPAQLDRESRYNALVRGFKDWTQILSNLGLGVAAINTLSK